MAARQNEHASHHRGPLGGGSVTEPDAEQLLATLTALIRFLGRVYVEASGQCAQAHAVVGDLRRALAFLHSREEPGEARTPGAGAGSTLYADSPHAHHHNHHHSDAQSAAAPPLGPLHMPPVWLRAVRAYEDSMAAAAAVAGASGQHGPGSGGGGGGSDSAAPIGAHARLTASLCGAARAAGDGYQARLAALYDDPASSSSSSSGGGARRTGAHTPHSGGAHEPTQPPKHDEYETVTVTETATGSEDEEAVATASGTASSTPAPAAASCPSLFHRLLQPWEPGSPLPTAATTTAMPTASAAATPSTTSTPTTPLTTTIVTAAPQPRGPAATSATAFPASVTGWVVASALLLSIRLGRAQAEDERTDVRVLQAKEQESRVQGADLRAKRRAFLEAERLRKEREAVACMQQRRAAAEREAAERTAKEAGYRAQQAVETRRVWEENNAARKAFQSQDSLMGEELRMRTEREVARRQAEAEDKRREQAAAADASAARARLEQRAVRAREADARARTDAEAAALATRRARLASASTVCTACFTGLAVVQPAPLNTQSTRGGGGVARLQVELTMGLSRLVVERAPSEASASSSSSGGSASASVSDNLLCVTAAPPPTYTLESYASVGDALRGRHALCARTCGAAAAVGARALAEALAEQGGSCGVVVMDVHEANYWARLCLGACLSRADQAVAQATPLCGSSRLCDPLSIDVPHRSLPHGHADRTDTRLMAAVGMLAGGRGDDAADMVERVIADEEDAVGAALAPPATTTYAPHARTRTLLLPPLLVPALVYAQLVDRAAGATGMSAPPPIAAAATAAVAAAAAAAAASGSECDESDTGDAVIVADAWLDAALEGSSGGGGGDGGGESSAGRLAREQLMRRACKLPQDALLPTARVIAFALGAQHPVSAAVSAAAASNMSARAVAEHKDARSRARQPSL
ncbi:hypothetical protein FOA52_013421 [Chlamydomonas sp. UWO 241]|nr:hypothetical protein FOA52_013421 [Chlamydomonas sp. UWO 241]